MIEGKDQAERPVPEGEKEDDSIYMIFRTGLFLVGKLVGGNKLVGPRVFSVIDNGARIQMTPLPGVPMFVLLGNDGFRYPVPKADKVMYDLYYKVTHPEEFTAPPIDLPPDEGRIVRVK